MCMNEIGKIVSNGIVTFTEGLVGMAVAGGVIVGLAGILGLGIAMASKKS